MLFVSHRKSFEMGISFTDDVKATMTSSVELLIDTKKFENGLPRIHFDEFRCTYTTNTWFNPDPFFTIGEEQLHSPSSEVVLRSGNKGSQFSRNPRSIGPGGIYAFVSKFRLRKNFVCDIEHYNFLIRDLMDRTSRSIAYILSLFFDILTLFRPKFYNRDI